MCTDVNAFNSSANPNPGTSPHRTPVAECDLILKGGVTSGVVYPLAIVELSKHYRYVNVGGASAGAIAAAATAAAEYRRVLGGEGASEGFERLARLPQDLGGGTFLKDLFQPTKRTRGVHRVLLAAMAPGGAALRALRASGALLVAFPLIPFGVLTLYVFTAESLLRWMPYSVSLPLAFLLAAAFLTLAVVADAIQFALHAAGAIVENRFGICVGSRGGPLDAIGTPPPGHDIAEYVRLLEVATAR